MMEKLLLKEYNNRKKVIEEEIKIKEERLAKIKKKVDKKYGIEPFIDGLNVTIHKNDKIVKIFSEEDKDVTILFKEIARQALNLSDKNLIISANVVTDRSGELVANAHDILYLIKDITKEPWFKRKSALKTLSFTNNIKFVQDIIVDNKEDIKRACKIISKLGYSKGATVRDYDSSYEEGSVVWNFTKK